MCKTVIQQVLLCAFLLCAIGISAQHQIEHPASDLNYDQIYAYGVDANITPAIDLLQRSGSELSTKDQAFKERFLARFVAGETPESDAEIQHEQIQELLRIFQSYWRKSMLDTTQNFDAYLASKVGPFLKKNYPPVKDMTIERDSIGYILSRYVHSQGFYTTKKVGKTGRLVDLPIWRNQLDTVYTFDLHKEQIKVPVAMMKNFISLGWIQYATLGRHYPGGWATKDTLFCVRQAYDLNSENFQISYLAHEGKHLDDYRHFPALKSRDLEYRAKLTELSLADESLFGLISFFIHQSNKASKNPHQFANYCLIRDLSKQLFNKDFEDDPEQWQKMEKAKINRAALRLLKRNTRQLQKQGEEVETVLTP